MPDNPEVNQCQVSLDLLAGPTLLSQGRQSRVASTFLLFKCTTAIVMSQDCICHPGPFTSQLQDLSP